MGAKDKDAGRWWWDSSVDVADLPQYKKDRRDNYLPVLILDGRSRPLPRCAIRPRSHEISVYVWGGSVEEAEMRAKQLVSAMRLAEAIMDGPGDLDIARTRTVLDRTAATDADELAGDVRFARSLDSRMEDFSAPAVLEYEPTAAQTLFAASEILNEEENALTACRRLADLLRAAGHEITPDWNTGG